MKKQMKSLMDIKSQRNISLTNNSTLSKNSITLDEIILQKHIQNDRKLNNIKQVNKGEFCQKIIDDPDPNLEESYRGTIQNISGRQKLKIKIKVIDQNTNPKQQQQQDNQYSYSNLNNQNQKTGKNQKKSQKKEENEQQNLILLIIETKNEVIPNSCSNTNQCDFTNNNLNSNNSTIQDETYSKKVQKLNYEKHLFCILQYFKARSMNLLHSIKSQESNQTIYRKLMHQISSVHLLFDQLHYLKEPTQVNEFTFQKLIDNLDNIFSSDQLQINFTQEYTQDTWRKLTIKNDIEKLVLTIVSIISEILEYREEKLKRKQDTFNQIIKLSFTPLSTDIRDGIQVQITQKQHILINSQEPLVTQTRSRNLSSINLAQIKEYEYQQLKQWVQDIGPGKLEQQHEELPQSNFISFPIYTDPCQRRLNYSQSLSTTRKKPAKKQITATLNNNKFSVKNNIIFKQPTPTQNSPEKSIKITSLELSMRTERNDSTSNQITQQIPKSKTHLQIPSHDVSPNNGKSNTHKSKFMSPVSLNSATPTPNSNNQTNFFRTIKQQESLENIKEPPSSPQFLIEKPVLQVQNKQKQKKPPSTTEIQVNQDQLSATNKLPSSKPKFFSPKCQTNSLQSFPNFNSSKYNQSISVYTQKPKHVSQDTSIMDFNTKKEISQILLPNNNNQNSQNVNNSNTNNQTFQNNKMSSQQLQIMESKSILAIIASNKQIDNPYKGEK